MSSYTKDILNNIKNDTILQTAFDNKLNQQYNSCIYRDDLTKVKPKKQRKKETNKQKRNKQTNEQTNKTFKIVCR